MKCGVLFVSGHYDDARILSHMLCAVPLRLNHVDSIERARAKLQQEDYDVILSEAALPDGTWLDALLLARNCAGGLEVIVTAPHADASFWAEALNLGAYDFLAQPFYEPEVRRILSNACSRSAVDAYRMVAV
jgi:DNA-binding NtrC family response regulator